LARKLFSNLDEIIKTSNSDSKKAFNKITGGRPDGKLTSIDFRKAINDLKLAVFENEDEFNKVWYRIDKNRKLYLTFEEFEDALKLNF